MQNLPPKSAVEKPPTSPGVLLENATSDKGAKDTIDAKQTSR